MSHASDPPPWPEVLATALIGTDRRPTGTADPAARVLDLAAVWTPYRRAGVRPATVDAGPPPAPAEMSPPASRSANARLELLLEGGPVPWDVAAREVLLAEWLDLAAERGLRIAPHLLPALLDFGRVRRDLRPSIADVGGARAPWLARLNPDWRYLAPASESTVDKEVPVRDTTEWETGNRAQRTRYFNRLRRADSDVARELLERDWPALTPDERVELVAALANGLSGADESLLERALDDRRKEVRDAAVALLVRLPASAHQARMAARARAYLSIGDGRKLAVSPPLECDAQMRRDGVSPKAPAGLGARAWWLEQVLALAPLTAWPGPAEEFVRRPVSDDWSATVHRGLARAAAMQRDPAWAAATLDVLGTAHPVDRAAAAALYPVLDAVDLVQRAIEALGQAVNATWGPLLAACPAPWQEGLGRAALEGIAAFARRKELAGDLYQLCRLAAFRLPVSFAPGARALAEQSRAEGAQPRTLSGLTNLAAVLEFRRDMTEELTDAAPSDDPEEMP